MNCHVTHLEAAIDGTRLAADRAHTMHKDRPLWVRYDLAAVKRSVGPDELRARPSTLWRYRELLPLDAAAVPVSLGEGLSPLLPAARLGEALGLSDLWIKDESQLPTASFKSRGMAVAVSMAKRFGLRRLAVPTAGNAGVALSAYGARAGLEVCVCIPADPRAGRRGLGGRRAGARRALPHDQRVACGRCELEGISGVGAARTLGVREGTMWRRLHDARKALRAVLDGGAR